MRYFKFLLKTLNRKEKIKLIFLGILMLFNTAFELLSIGLIIPVISIIFKKDLTILPDQLKNFFNNYEQIDLALYTLLLLILIFLLKNLFILFFHYQQALYSRNVQVRIAKDLFGKYISQNYLFFLQKDTGTILRNVNASRSISLSISSYLILFLEATLIISFFIYLLFLSFISTLAIGCSIFFLIIITYKLTKKKIFNLVELKQDLEALLNKHIFQSFSLIKNIKIFNKEKKIYDYFSKAFFKFENLHLKVDFIQQIPRAVTEVIVVLCLSIVVIILLNYDNSPIDIISKMAVYAAITFRLMPSTTKVISSLQRIKTYGPSLELIESEYSSFENKFILTDDQKKQKIKLENIEFEHVSFNYKNNSNKILDDLNFKITHGNIIGIYGASGSGKSTLVNLMSGLIKPSNGQIKINNKNLESVKKEWLASLGYVPQQVTLFNTTIANNVSFFEDKEDLSKLKKKLSNAFYLSNLEDFISKLPNKEYTKVGEGASKISGGQTQRIGIARALYNEPEFLIFDESTSSLDKENENEIMDNIYKIKKKKKKKNI